MPTTATIDLLSSRSFAHGHPVEQYRWLLENAPVYRHQEPDGPAECATHLRKVTRGGRIRCTVTVFAPDTPERPGPRIHNEQLIRYAGKIPARSARSGVIGRWWS